MKRDGYILRLIHKLDNMVSLRKKDYLEPKISMHDNDLVIASFPKSGNTWVRFFFANLLFPEKRPITFMNVINYIPELSDDQSIILNTNLNHNPITVYKSHSLFTENYKNVIYLVRDGRDAYLSYFYYLHNRVSGIKSLNDVLTKEDLFPSHWQEHCASWLHNRHQNLLVIRYEDLRYNCYPQFKKMVEFLNLPYSDMEIYEAANQCNFNTMSKLEDQFGRPFLNQNEIRLANKFMRKGIVGDWRSHYNLKEKELFNRRNVSMLIELGYESSKDW